MSSKKRLILLLIPLVLLISGCGQISTEYTGLWNSLVLLFAHGIVWLGEFVGSTLGWGIILMTLIIRLALLPLYGKQIKSTEKTKLIQPKITALNKKYANKKDQESQRKKAQEQQAIYKEAGINPLAGCLPMLIQLPLLIAFYNAIQYLVPAKATITQLTESGQQVIYGLEELGSNLTTTFFNFELGEPVLIFAFLAAVTTFLTSYVSMIGQDKDAPGASMMKGMLYVMPAMIFIFGLTLPGALSIYWLVGNVVSILQTLYFKRSVIQNERQKKKFAK